MELEDMQVEMNMLFSELVLASDEREVVLLMLLTDLAKGMVNRAGLRIQSGINAVGDTVTTREVATAE